MDFCYSFTHFTGLRVLGVFNKPLFLGCFLLFIVHSELIWICHNLVLWYLWCLVLILHIHLMISLWYNVCRSVKIRFSSFSLNYKVPLYISQSHRWLVVFLFSTWNEEFIHFLSDVYVSIQNMAQIFILGIICQKMCLYNNVLSISTLVTAV